MTHQLINKDGILIGEFYRYIDAQKAQQHHPGSKIKEVQNGLG